VLVYCRTKRLTCMNIFVGLWIGFLVGNWLPIVDLGRVGSTRAFEVAIGFLLTAVLIEALPKIKPGNQ
jgi:hypothetical protein